tara:strand:- start:759 stop:1601 length:843 start_codon:yes stop_codon:yes gene_type:complete
MLIISLTTIPHRISTLNQVIDSILRNTHLPNLIVLNLNVKDFPNKENDLPENLNRFLSKEIFEINWCNEDRKSYEKLLPTLENYGFDNDIITIDDDVIYPTNFISTFINSKSKNLILCYRAREVRIHRGKFLPYNTSRKIYHHPSLKPDFSYLFTGVGGVFYPANSLNHDVLNYQLISDYFCHQDDIWFWINSISNGNKVKVIGLDNKPMTKKDFKENFIDIASANTISLWSQNKDGANNEALSNALSLYPNLNQLVRSINIFHYYFRWAKKLCLDWVRD